MDKDTVQIVSTIYDSIIYPLLWSDVLASLVELTDSESGLLLSYSNDPEHCSVTENYNIDPYWLKLYDEHYYQYDPTMETLARSPNKIVTNHVAGTERDKITGKPRVFYNEVLVPQNFYHTAGYCMRLETKNHHALILTRNKSQGEYCHDKLGQLKYLTSHISKALSISQKLWEKKIINDMLSGVLGVAELGVILLNKSGRTVYISDQAEIAIKTTRSLLLRNGTILANHHNDNARLQHMINESISAATGKSLHGGGCIRLSDNQNTVELVVIPISHERFGSHRFEQPVYTAIIISKENSTASLPRQALIDLYGLSKSEADLVAKLAGGLSLQDIAEVNCRSKETIRSQLKSAMRKTSTKQQSDLVRLVTTCIARFVPEV